MKTFNKEDMFSWGNAEEAKQYIGKLCYFGDSLYELKKNIEINHSKTLLWVDNNNSTVGVNSIFECVSEDDPNSIHYSQGLMIPVDKVKEVEEKKYRPFKNPEEFAKVVFNSKEKNTVACHIKVKDIAKKEEYIFLIQGIFIDGLILPLYGMLTFQQLFQTFIICYHDEWQPFGVKE